MSDFKKALGKRESSGNYKAKNKLGYLGKYQFGKMALQDTGYKDSKGKWTGKDGINSEEDFLNNPEVQEEAMNKYVERQRRYLKNKGATKYIGKKFKDIDITESGLAAAAHLVGAGGVNRMLKTGKVPKDAFGTPATEYLKKFSGYDLDDKGEDSMQKEDKLKKLETIKEEVKPVKEEVSEQERLQTILESLKQSGAAYQSGGLGLTEEERQEAMGFINDVKLGNEDVVEEPDTLDASPVDILETPDLEVDKEELDLEAPDLPKISEMEDPSPTLGMEEEDPEKKQEPLTMETLEQRFQDLMKASKKERQTAAWATAASQIASMIDRASANPIGIKPINFQAGDASAEAKDLLSLGRMKGLGADRGMTEYQKAAIKERQADRALAEKKLKALALKAPKQNLTEAEKAVDKNYAKEYADYIAAGGSKTSESDINKLDELAKEMKENKDIFEGPLDKAVEYLGGFDTVRSAVNPKLQDIKSRLEQIIQQDLRTTLGAQFTEKEGKQFLERSFDPKLGYEENKKRLDDFIKMVKSRANARMKSAKYFEDKGTLKGFKGTEDSSLQSDSVLLQAPNGQTKRVKRSAMQKYLDKGAKVIGE